MKISLIVAMACNRAIGINNKMPWHLPADLKRFKAITMGAPILMGRKTFESIGKPLPGRTNIIITRNHDYQPAGCQIFHTISSALEYCRNSPELFVIGGASLYQDLLPVADYLYLTEIKQVFDGDTFFPEIEPSQWLEIERIDVFDDPSTELDYSFVKLQKLK